MRRSRMMKGNYYNHCSRFLFLQIGFVLQTITVFIVDAAAFHSGQQYPRSPNHMIDWKHQQRLVQQLYSLKSQKNKNKDPTDISSNIDSLGSFIVQIQKSEEAILAKGGTGTINNNNHQIVNDDDAVVLRPIKTTTPTSDMYTMGEGMNGMEPSISSSSTAMLDTIQAITSGFYNDTSSSTITQFNQSSTIPNSVINPTVPSSTISTTNDTPPMKRRSSTMDRNRKHFAVSIAASLQDVNQWRQFCYDHGGVYPIVETIRDGASIIRRHAAPKKAKQHQQQEEQDYVSITDDESYLKLSGNARDQYEEETFYAACSACRAIRDLCAISPELAAVITDSVLRADATWGGGLMKDFQTILQYATDYATATKAKSARDLSQRLRFRNRRDIRLRCQLYVNQLLLAMAVASDDAVHAIRVTKGLQEAIVSCSSYAITEQTRRWLRYPGEMIKWLYRRSTTKRRKNQHLRRPFLEAANISNDLNGQVQRTANQILAAIGYNKWVPKIPGQKGLRILSLDGGGSRGMVAISAVKCLMDAAGNGADVADTFDMIVGTSTGGIIAFLVGLQRESSAQAVERYQQLIDKIFVKSALSAPLMLFTTATYDESNFMGILVDILKENSMLDSRADPAVPLVCCLSSKMSSTPTHVALFRNYNYAGGEYMDPFTVDPLQARQELELPLDLEHDIIKRGKYHRITTSVITPGVKTQDGSRHPGSFRVLQRYALRASTAAPTVFKPVMMGGEMYCDGGIVASNPTAVAIHEARSIFRNIPIELVVSVGTGAFVERKSASRFGWDGILGQIINSATDGEQIHHILEDVLGTTSVLGSPHQSASGKTRYFRFNPVVGSPDDFPIDVTDPIKLAELRDITKRYMSAPDQIEKLERIGDILKGRMGLRRRVTQALTKTFRREKK